MKEQIADQRLTCGQRFGRWTVLGGSMTTPQGERKYLCRCDCGTERYVLERSLLYGGSQSCGCLRKEMAYQANAAQWDDTLNVGLTPEMVTPGSHKRVWWRCDEGHIWKTAIYSRTGKQKCGCPVCAGKTKQPSQYARP